MLRGFIKKRIPPFFDEFTLKSVDLNNNEAMEFYDFDEIEVDMSFMCLTFIESEVGSTMNTHEFINYDLKNPTYLLRKELIGVLDERDDIANN